jgi:hypothetical protein
MSKNLDCNGCFYEEVDPREGSCNTCFATAKYVHKDVFKGVSDSPVFKQTGKLLWVYDTVNKPKHYMLFSPEEIAMRSVDDKGIEVRDVIEKLVVKMQDASLDKSPSPIQFPLFEADYVQMMQYLMRFMDKNGVEDLKKASWYLKKMISAYDDK